MEVGALLFVLAMILLVAAYVLKPLSRSERGVYRDSSQELSALEAERDRLLDSIQEIDMDRTMGKVPEEAYQRQRKALALEGAEIMRTIDELHSDGAPDNSAMELEAAIAALRGKGRSPEMKLEAAVADKRSQGSGSNFKPGDSQHDPGKGACPECGEAFRGGDRFCTHCGAALEEHVA